MADRNRNWANSLPEGRGCLYVSAFLVAIALIAFAVAAWISTPDGTPNPGPAAIAPPTQPVE